MSLLPLFSLLEAARLLHVLTLDSGAMKYLTSTFSITVTKSTDRKEYAMVHIDLIVDYHEAMLLSDAILSPEMLAYNVKFFPNFLILLTLSGCLWH